MERRLVEPVDVGDRQVPVGGRRVDLLGVTLVGVLTAVVTLVVRSIGVFGLLGGQRLEIPPLVVGVFPRLDDVTLFEVREVLVRPTGDGIDFG